MSAYSATRRRRGCFRSEWCIGGMTMAVPHVKLAPLHPSMLNTGLDRRPLYVFHVVCMTRLSFERTIPALMRSIRLYHLAGLILL